MRTQEARALVSSNLCELRVRGFIMGEHTSCAKVISFRYCLVLELSLTLYLQIDLNLKK